MEKEIILKVREFYEESFKNACPELQSFFRIHTKDVLENALILAKKRGADLEIIEISALLHDIASLQGLYEEHNVKGAEIAEKLLSDLKYPLDKIKRVKNIILNHRGSKPRNVTTIEEQILIDADAMSHFNEIETLRENYYPSNKKVLEKLERSYNKMSPEVQVEIKPKLEQARVQLK